MVNPGSKGIMPFAGGLEGSALQKYAMKIFQGYMGPLPHTPAEEIISSAHLMRDKK